METLAYLHLASAYESPMGATPVLELHSLKFLEWLKQQKLSTHARIFWLSLVVILSILGMANEALAQVLRRGDRSPEVIEVQRRLQELNYFTAEPTGFFGEITENAVIRFQQERGLQVDGIVGEETLAELFEVSRSSFSSPFFTSPQPLAFGTPLPNPLSANTLRRGDQGEDVRQLQIELRRRGFSPGAIDGIYGENTERAVREFQRSQRLFVDGVAGSATLSALRGSTSTGVGGPDLSNLYVVVVPVRNNNTLVEVRRYIGNATLDDSKRGQFVNAGVFVDRNEAESRSNFLRAQGLDARVAFR